MKPIAANNKQPWIKSALFDGVWVLAPSFLALAVVALLPPSLRNGTAMPLAAWVVLILMIDVAHVYSTLFRTYLDPQRFAKQRTLFLWTPLLCYIGGALLYTLGAMVFWRVLAYLAVFHFVRQQYGFMRLYSRAEDLPRWMKRIDVATIYAATLYPILHWHFSGGRAFSWFVNGDFLALHLPGWILPLGVAYLVILLVYVVKETILVRQHGRFNIPRNAVVAGTALSWYCGIVLFNGDLVFTLLNVVAHGIPYMALVWAARPATSSGKTPSAPGLSLNAGWAGALFFVGVILCLAFIEEGIWDGMVWREHRSLFAPFQALPLLTDHVLLSLLVPLLSLPQATHYVLDGFIWRLEK